MKLDARSFALVAFVGLAACSATLQATPGGGATDTDGGAEASSSADAATASPDATTTVPSEAGPGENNPYGVPYPTANLGWRARAGRTAGLVMPNVKLVGYLPGASATSPVSLADVFDPQGKTHDLVAVFLCASWSAPSNQLMAEIDKGAPKRVAMLAVLGEAASVGTPATLGSLEAWRPKVPATVHNLLDPSWSKFTGITVDAVPYVVLLDARSMEIVSASPGFSASPAADLEAAAADVKARPVSY